MLGKTEARRRKGQQRIRCLDDITDSVNMSLGELWEIVKEEEIGKPGVLQPMESQRVIHDSVTKQ